MEPHSPDHISAEDDDRVRHRWPQRTRAIAEHEWLIDHHIEEVLAQIDDLADLPSADAEGTWRSPA